MRKCSDDQFPTIGDAEFFQNGFNKPNHGSGRVPLCISRTAGAAGKMPLIDVRKTYTCQPFGLAGSAVFQIRGADQFFPATFLRSVRAIVQAILAQEAFA